MNQNKNVVKKKKNYKPAGKGKPNMKVTKQIEFSKSDKFDRNDIEPEHKYNDVSWYTKNDAMLRDAASLSYNTPLGSALNMASVFEAANSANTIQVSSSQDSVPGLMSLDLVPTIGVSTTSASAANLAAQNIYSYVRYQNSGAKNYDQADLMLYLLAMDNEYSFWNYCKRAYGLLSMYSQYNRYMPRMYFAAMNWDFDDFISNIADFRLFLNQAAAEISSFCVPASMSYFVRHSWLYSNIYKDSDNLKAQQYMFNPQLFYKYDETGSEYGGRLVPQLMPQATGGTPMTFAQLRTFYRSMTDAIAYSEDIGVMSGDILKAYGEGSLFKLEAVQPDYVVTPVYNEEVLNQIHNSTIVSGFWTKSVGMTDEEWTTVSNSYIISQNPNTGFLIYDPIVSLPSVGMTKAVLNMPWDEVTPANTMVGTRLTVLAVDRPDVTITGGANAGKISSMGSEFVCKRTIYQMNPPYGAINTRAQYNNAQVIQNNTLSTQLLLIALTSQFDWHPLMPLFTYASNVYTFAGLLGDISNYTVVEGDTLDHMHTTAIMSEFNIPQLGSF